MLEHILETIVKKPKKHALWLNTLSYLENCGAKKIASCEHPTKVKEEMLKHAAEEFRHAYYLKRQINKLEADFPVDYRLETILGGHAASRYLDRLDTHICRKLKQEFTFFGFQLKEIAYFLVTYAIETRASHLYPLYQRILSAMHSPISVKGIIMEEQEHLQEMTNALKRYRNAEAVMHAAMEIEMVLFQRLTHALREIV